VKSVLVNSHTDTSTASFVRTIFARSGDLTFLVNLVELEDSQLGVLVHVSLLLWLGVSLLLSLFGTTTKAKH